MRHHIRRDCNYGYFCHWQQQLELGSLVLSVVKIKQADGRLLLAAEQLLIEKQQVCALAWKPVGHVPKPRPHSNQTKRVLAINKFQ